MKKMVDGAIIENLESFRTQNEFTPNEAIVLEKNENSDLIDYAKPCSQEFFLKLFTPTGAFWSLYEQLGLAFRPPATSAHAVFVGSQLYFCKNFEDKYLSRVGPRKKFVFKNDSVKQEFDFTAESLLLTLAIPFDWASQVAGFSLASLKINESARRFEGFRKKSLEDCALLAQEKNPARLAEKALAKACEAMTYSFAASLGYTLKIKPTPSPSWQDCEQDDYAALSGNPKELRKRFGFHSPSPYDVSTPRFKESLDLATAIGTQPKISNPFMRLRENAKFTCSRFLSLQRQAYLQAGSESGLGEKIFFLKTSELEECITDPNAFLHEITSRQKAFQQSQSPLPKQIFYASKWVLRTQESKQIQGIPGGGPATITGQAVEVNTTQDYSKNVEGKIIISRTLSPNLVSLYSKATGVISATGGMLSHCAIVAREKNLPCIVSVKGFDQLREGQNLQVNGKTGQIKTI